MAYSLALPRRNWCMPGTPSRRSTAHLGVSHRVPFRNSFSAFAAAEPADRSDMASHGGSSSPRSDTSCWAEISCDSSQSASIDGPAMHPRGTSRCMTSAVRNPNPTGSTAGGTSLTVDRSRSTAVGSDPALLGRAAAVVRQRGDVLDGLDREPGGLEGA